VSQKRNLHLIADHGNPVWLSCSLAIMASSLLASMPT